MDFDPGPDDDIQAGPDFFESIFVTRFNVDGTHGWTRTFIADENFVLALAAIRVNLDLPVS